MSVPFRVPQANSWSLTPSKQIRLTVNMYDVTSLTHCGLVTSYGAVNLGQHWLGWWLVAWRHRAITSTNIGTPSARSSGIHFKVIFTWIPKIPIPKLSWNLVIWSYSHIFQGVNVWMTGGANYCDLIYTLLDQMIAPSWPSDAHLCHQTWLLFSFNKAPLKILFLTHWGRDKMAAISQTTFSNAFSWMKMYIFRLKFHWSLCPRVQLTIFQHWFR